MTPFQRAHFEMEELFECSLCPRLIWMVDSYSPGDEMICAECDTEVTGDPHPPSIPPTPEGLALLKSSK